MHIIIHFREEGLRDSLMVLPYSARAWKAYDKALHEYLLM